MCSSSNIILSCLLFYSVVAKDNSVSDAVGFPEMEEDPRLVNRDNRLPVYSPARCPVNELFYPGDQKDDWICDCRPAHIYHPKTDQCWPAYRKGPCQDGEYLVLPPNTAIPACVRNPCDLDGYVVYGGKCYRLGTPCDIDTWPHTTALEVNATNLEIGCGIISVAARFSGLRLPAGIDLCPPGSKRCISGKCVPIVQ